MHPSNKCSGLEKSPHSKAVFEVLMFLGGLHQISEAAKALSVLTQTHNYNTSAKYSSVRLICQKSFIMIRETLSQEPEVI